MPVIVHTTKSHVSAMWGRSYIREANGKFRLLALGDMVQRGDVILTEQNAIVKLSEPIGDVEAPKVACDNTSGTSEMDRVIAGIECGDESVATAAGNSGTSADGGLLQGERVERVREDLTPASMLTPNSSPGSLPVAGATPIVVAIGTPSVARVIGVQTIGSSTNTEDQALIFPVTLDGASTTSTTLPFEVQLETASASDITDPIFSNGVALNADGSITVPAGITEFVVTIPLSDDAIVEGTERLTVRIGSQSASGTIVDNDVPLVVGVEPGAPGAGDDAVTEGQSLVYTVTLGEPTASASIYPFVLGGGSASSEDLDQPVFSNGVVLNGDGTLTVPSGVSSFTVTLPTVDDTLVEAQESVPVSVGGVSSLGFITDNDQGLLPTLTVSLGDPAADDDQVPEGGDLVFNVQLSSPTTVATTYPFEVGLGSAGQADVGSPVLTNGVVINDNGTLTVPAGVSSFTVTVPTVQDVDVEEDETFSLTIDDSSATGTIVDDDRPSVARIELAPPRTADAAPGQVIEGEQVVCTVTLTEAPLKPVTFPFSLGGGTAAANDFGTPVFSDGVVLNADGTITVPSGVASFSVTIPTVDDSVAETAESVPMTIDAVSVTSTILDNDKPTVTRIQLTPPGEPVPGADPTSVVEGGALNYEVQLSQPTAEPTPYSFTLGGGTAGGNDIGTPIFSNGVVLNPDNTITVPAGVSSFTVTVPSVQDTVVEPDETVSLTIDGSSATGTIVDDDRPSVARIELAPPRTADAAPGQVIEGEQVVCTVTLTQAPLKPVTFPFSLGGGSAAAGDFGTPQFSDGVVLNGDGTITVPPGVASFTVTIPTVDDSVCETAESVPMTIDAVSVTSTILDNDKPSVTRIQLTPLGESVPDADPASVVEGGALNYEVQLSQPTAEPTPYSFVLGGGTAAASDIGAPVFSNGVVLNPDNTITVPAGVSSFTVTVPTQDDAVCETAESVPLRIDAVVATGTIQDNDMPVVVQVDPMPGVSSGTGANALGTTEGDDVFFSVKLSQDTVAETRFAFALTPGSTGADEIGSPVFSNGVRLNGDGTVTVPAGVSSFVVRVPTIQDTVVEQTEDLAITVGTVSARGDVLDDDRPAVVKVELTPPDGNDPGIAADTVTEGGTLHYTVQLDQATVVPTTYAFGLGGGTAGAADFGQPVFSQGVVLNADGTITVPPGVTAFKVTVPTVQDTVVETNETVPLQVGQVEAVGTIRDDDQPGIVSIEPVRPDATGRDITEGEDASFTVTLGEPPVAPATYPFSLGGGSAEGNDIGVPTFSNGVTLNANGTITVPAGVGSFCVTVPTVDDGRVEATETLPLSIGGVSASANILDNDKPFVVKIELTPPTGNGAGLDAATVAEGNALHYRVELDQPTAAPVPYAFSLGGGTAGADDLGQPSFSNGVVLNADGSITVPAGVTSFVVTVPTVQDSVIENVESVPLSIDNVKATGYILDDDRNTAPSVQSVVATVSEEGLAGGLSDAVGNPSDTGDRPVVSGKITISDAEGQAITQVVLTAPTMVLTSGGEPVVWSGSGTGSLTATAAGELVAQLSIDASGEYQFSLHKPLDHAPGQGENLLDLDFGVGASDGTDQGTGTLRIQVEDDAPVAANVVAQVAVPSVATNVMLVLDVSGSMGQSSGIGGLNRLQAAVKSMEVLLERYAEQGDVAVRLVTFGTEGQAIGDRWSSVSEAKVLLSKLCAAGGTNYDDALADAMSAFGSPGRIEGGQNVSYFLSDGAPTFGSGDTSTLAGARSGNGHDSTGADVGIQANEMKVWTDFLDAQGIQSHAIGIGTGISNVAALDPIAHDGRSGTDAAGQLVTQLNDLPAALLQTTHGKVSGSLWTGGTGGLGADGGHVQSFTLEGVEYRFDPAANGGAGAVQTDALQACVYDSATKTLTVSTQAGGSFDIDLDDGHYTYTAPAPLSTGLTETFGFSLIDGDGDVSSAQGQVLVEASAAPPAPVVDTVLEGKVVGEEDKALSLDWSRFSGSSNLDGCGIRFNELPADGKLQVYQHGCWQNLAAGQTVSKQVIDASGLRFVPDAHEAGSDAYADAGVGNGKTTYALLDFAVEARDGRWVSGKLEVDIQPIADSGALLKANTMLAWSSSGAPAGHQQWEAVRADGSVTSKGDGEGYYGMWHRIRLDACSSSCDKDGSEEMFYQVRVNQVDAPSAPTVVALSDGTVLQPANDGAYWVPANAVDSVLIFRQWGAGPNGNVFSHQTASATIWNAEMDGAGEILHMVKGNTITSAANTPLVLDLDGDGVETVAQAAGAKFDFAGQGQAVATGWVGSDDGLLVLDRDGDGQITNGRELFGDAVVLGNGSQAADGYAALTDLDGNRDGQIDAQDDAFTRLQVWRDRDTDGLQEAGELLSLGELGISSLSLAAQAGSGMQNGNQIALVSTFTRSDGSSSEMADVRFGHERVSDGSAATDDASSLTLGYEQGMAGWAANAGESEGNRVDAAVAEPDGEGLDLRDLLGGGTSGQEPVQLDTLLDELGVASGTAPREASSSDIVAGPVGASEETVSWTASVSNGEDRLLQELLNPNKLDNGF